MGALFCGCEKKEIDASVPDFEAKQPTQQKGGPKREIKNFNKNDNLNEIWSSLDNSHLIGKGIGNPKEKYEFIEQIGLGSFSQIFKVKVKQTGGVGAVKVIKKKINQFP